MSRDGLFSERVSSAPKLGTAKRFTEKVEFTPGPGAYNTKKSSLNDHGTVISSAKRFGYTGGASRRSASQDPPGPAAYNTSKSTFTHKGGVMSRSSRNFAWQKTTSPGPNVYNSPNSTFKKGGTPFSTARRSKSMSAVDTPGPNAYNTCKSTLRTNGCTFGRSGRDIHFTKGKTVENVGPAMYSSTKSTLSTKGAPIGRSKKASTLDRQQSSPGPGDYTPNYIAQSNIRKSH